MVHQRPCIDPFVTNGTKEFPIPVETNSSLSTEMITTTAVAVARVSTRILIILACVSRWDMAFGVDAVSRSTAKNDEAQWITVKWMIRYLKRTSVSSFYH